VRFIEADWNLYPPGIDWDDEHRLTNLLFNVRTIGPLGTALSHDTAVRFLGLPADQRLDGTRPHVTVPIGANLDRKAFTVHVARLPPEDVCVANGWNVTTPERTFLDIAAGLDYERLVVIGDAMLRAGMTTADALRARVDVAHRVRGVRFAREVVPFLDSGAQSPPESILRWRFHRVRLPPPRLQYPIQLRGYVVHVDMAWPEARTALEYEGRQHAEADQFALDLDRYTALASEGWLVLRAGSRDLANTDRLVRRVAATLRGRRLLPR
jgi:very-short-patch-repair endonuclease